MNSTQKLQENIAEAKQILIPRFRVTHLEQERLIEADIEIYDGRTRYHFEENKLRFNEKELGNPIAIGEEISHWVHLRINPLVNPMGVPVSERLPYHASIEMVGRYGALSYAAAKRLPYEPWKRRILELSPADDPDDVLGHDWGYERAYKLFELHGDQYLPILARMGINDSLDLASIVAPVSWLERRVEPLLRKLPWTRSKAKSLIQKGLALTPKPL